MEKGAVISFKY